MLAGLLLAADAAPWQPSDGLILKGDVVTMDSGLTVVSGGRVVITNDRIVAVLKPGEPLPAVPDLTSAKVIDTQGYILPGLIDGHNHVEYNMLPLWTVPKLYGNRYQWAGIKQYQQDITNPKNLLTDDAFAGLRVEVVKYGEIKALLGGTTSVQGSPDLIPTRYLVRNIENPNFGTDRIFTSVLSIDDARFQKDAKDKLIQNIEAGLVDAWVVHLAEGTDSASRQEFATLKRLGLLRSKTVIIHGTALEAPDFAEMAHAGSKLVWSPLSNLLLYGRTTDIPAALSAGVLVCLGCDWSPSGSKNLLGELKIAHEYDLARWGHVLSDVQLVEMVTLNPAVALGIDDKIGRIKAGYYADLAVFHKRDPDPYKNLVEATERDVRLVIVGGVPYYGDRPLMQELKGDDWEPITVFGSDKAIDVTDPSFALGRETLGEIQGQLSKALLAAPDWLRQKFGASMGDAEFAALLKKKFPGLHAIALDGLLPDDAFFTALTHSTNAHLGFDIAHYWVLPPGSDTGNPDQLALNLVNDPATTFDLLDQKVGLYRRAALEIIRYRDGPDGSHGTADDRRFGTVTELDRVPYVSQSAINLLRKYAVGTPH